VLNEGNGMKRNRESQIPIACSLAPTVLGDRELAWRELLRSSLLARERIAGGLRLTVSAVAVSSLRQLVDLERGCCPWITFNLEGDSLTMTAPGAGEEMLVQMFR
jgi:hypothetical protein